jgi:hypothetical protein
MRGLLREPVRLLPDAGAAQAGPGGRQDCHHPRPHLHQGVRPQTKELT